jgi:PAS domain S-box-containing protein
MAKHIEILKYFVDNHSDLVIIFDKDYKIIFINQAYCHKFGKKYAELKDKDFRQLILETDRERVVDSLNNITFDHNFTNHRERVICPTEIRWMDWRVQGRFDAKGNLLDYFAIGRDVTEQKRMQEELELIKSRHETAEIIGGTGNWEYDIIKEIFWASAGAKTIYGFPLDKEGFTTETVENCIPDRKNVHQALEDLIEENKPYDLEFEIQPLNQKEPRIIISKAILRKNETGQPIKIMGVIQDITRRNLAETKLIDSEQRYRYLIDGASDAIYLIDQKGDVIEANNSACKMLGYSKEDFLDMSISDIDKNYTLETFLEFWKHQELRETQIFETTHTHKDGHQIPVEVSGLICIIKGDIVFYGLARDITERQKAETKLRTSEERFKLAVEGTHDGLWDWDLRTDCTYFSDRYATMLGYDPDELTYTGDAWKDLLHPDDLNEVLKKVDEYLQQKNSEYKSTFRMLCKEGYYRWITGRGKALWDENGKPYRFIGFNTDITTRQNSERAFIKSEEKYHMLYETLSEGVMFFNKQSEIIDANPAAQKILNFTLPDVRGSKLTSLKRKTIHEDGSDFTLEERPLSISLNQGKYCRSVLMGISDAQRNKIIWLSINSAPIYEDDSDSPTGAYTVFSDITGKKQAKDQLEIANKTLLAAQDMANVGYWTYEIKTGYLIWSKQMFTIFGLDPDDDVPNYEQHKNLIHSDDWDMFDESVKKCREGVPNNLKLKINFPDGSTRHIISQGFPRYSENGEIFEIFGTSQDITEFKQKEIELEQHRNHLEQLVLQRTKKLEKQNKELRHYHELFIGREFRIKELKDELEKLKQELETYRSNK